MTLTVIVIIIILFTFATIAKGVSKNMLEWDSNRPNNLLELITIHADAQNIPKTYLGSIIYIESRGNPKAVNPNDPSFGIAQFTIATANSLEGRQVNSQELFDAEFSIKLCALFLKILRDKYELRRGLRFSEWSQAYNVGETKFDRGIRNPDYGAKIRDIQTNERIFMNPEEIANFMEVRGFDL